MPVEPLADKWRAFRWNVVEIDGHKMEEIVPALESCLYRNPPDCANPGARHPEDGGTGTPTVIIAKTVKGRGVSFMENNPAWHGAAPNDAQAQIALAEIAEGLR
jgi:transketolase